MGIIKYMRKREDDRKKTFRALSLVTQLGMIMIVSIGMTTAAGIWLDKKLGIFCFTAIFFIIGAVAGGQSAYRLIQQIDKDEDND